MFGRKLSRVLLQKRPLSDTGHRPDIRFARSPTCHSSDILSMLCQRIFSFPPLCFFMFLSVRDIGRQVNKPSRGTSLVYVKFHTVLFLANLLSLTRFYNERFDLDFEANIHYCKQLALFLLFCFLWPLCATAAVPLPTLCHCCCAVLLPTFCY